uniref:NADH dehydrogenase subunit 6 n=1 Tax=Elaeophora elaphi TaxID=1147741 RepID=A0A0R3RI89_9BILA
MVFSSFCALVEKDSKKIVALSTMSQIGFCFLSIGSVILFFKILLFMQIGYLIFINMGQRNFRVQLQIFLSVVCLCGLLFTRGCSSKDFLLVFFYFISVFLTFCYCCRIIFLFRVAFSGFNYAGFSSKCNSLVFFFLCFEGFIMLMVIVLFSKLLYYSRNLWCFKWCEKVIYFVVFLLCKSYLIL